MKEGDFILLCLLCILSNPSDMSFELWENSGFSPIGQHGVIKLLPWWGWREGFWNHYFYYRQYHFSFVRGWFCDLKPWPPCPMVATLTYVPRLCFWFLNKLFVMANVSMLVYYVMGGDRTLDLLITPLLNSPTPITKLTVTPLLTY